VAGAQRYRVLIISSDEYNERPGASPWGLSVTPHDPGPAIYTVALTVDDAITHGTVVVPYVMRCNPAGLVRSVGFVSERTYRTVEYSLREFLELP